MRKKMKKNLLTLMFVVTFLCFGATFASAKTSSPIENSVNTSAKAMSIKIKALKAKCKQDCGFELQNLQNINDIYESYCAAGGYQSSCQPGLAAI
jgi:ABC-type transporter MlaC component